MIVTIDGPSGTGKTTVARTLAERLRFVYFDTGAMYRALTWFVLQHSVDIHNGEALQELLSRFSFNVQYSKGQKRYFVGNEDVTEVIRSQPITAHVSAVSALKMVRDSLLDIQHRFAKNRDVVFEGRDLGTVVFPKAEVKIFLTADPEVRAERRFKELLEKYPDAASGHDRKTIRADLQRRDALDSSRQVAPLKCPDDAHTIDTSQLSVAQIVEEIASFVHNQPRAFNKGNAFYRFIIFLTKSFFKLFYRHKVYGREHFCTGGGIIASNHASYLDPPAVAISSPEELHFLAKEELFNNLLFAKLICALNSHPVKGGPGDMAVLRMICKLLGEGKKVLLFPEGKRSDVDELDALKPGIALLVARSKAFVIPTYLYGTFALWNNKRKFPKLWGKTACVFGSPIRWEEFEHLDKKEASELFTQRLFSAMNALRHWYHNGAAGTPP
ncbi:MAG TPA: (d)CMP kinase [Rhabdochlamydiaceae bacterium]|jgi:cytidylate kinase